MPGPDVDVEVVEVVLLGTGTPMPDPARCGSGVAVLAAPARSNASRPWVLVDCGRGVTQRAIEAGLDLGALVAVALTHHHSDHVSDLATLATTRWVDGATRPLTVIAPAGPCARFAAACLDGFEDQAFHAQRSTSAPLRPTIDVDAFAATAQPAVVFDNVDWRISAALVDHAPIEAAVGYRIEAHGRIVTVSGDTARCAGIEQLAAGTDLLVHEALRSDRCSQRLLEWNASAGAVAAMADALGLRAVVFTHLLPAPESAADEQAFVDEARAAGYRGELIIAHDLMRLAVPG